MRMKTISRINHPHSIRAVIGRDAQIGEAMAKRKFKPTANQQKILDVLNETGRMSIAELAEKTGFSFEPLRSTCRLMQSRGWVVMMSDPADGEQYVMVESEQEG
jgi:predicted HTH transcriptional regulator